MRCQDCPNDPSPFVGGSGNKECCKIMVIGTAPGRVEEETGVAFTGNGGKLVREIMEDLRLEGDAYFTNIFKRKPRKADGEPKKITMADCQSCGGCLLAEVVELEPIIILALGQIPLKFMMPGARHTVSQIHGLPIEMTRFNHNYILIPSFDPSFVLRRGGLSSEVGDMWVNDFIDVKQKLEEYFG